MADFDINVQRIKQTKREQEELISKIDGIRKSLSGLRNDLHISGSGVNSVKRAIDQINSLLSNLSGDARELKEVLTEIANIYERTEADIVGSAKNKTKIKNAMSQLKNIYNDIKDFFSGMKHDCWEYAGDPVNICTGNYIAETDELFLDGLHPIDLKRYYNSVSEHRGVMGNGWTHSYEIHMEREQEENQISIFWGDGRRDVYELREGENYVNIYGGTECVIKENGKFCHVSEEREKTWFSDTGLVEKSEDSQGSCLLFSYEEEKLAKIENESGVYILFSYNEDGYLTEVEDSSGRSIGYFYENGLLAEVADVNDCRIKYIYDEDRRVASTVNAKDVVALENEYDGDGRVLLQKFPDGSEMQYKYNDAENRIDFVERNGNVIRYIHDEKMRHIATEYIDGVESHTYNDRNLRTSYTDKMGNKVQFTYDDRGNVTSVIDALGQKKSFTYDANNNLISTRDALSQQTTYSYDDKGNLVKSVDAMGNITEMFYDAKGDLLRVEHPDHSKIQMEYDDRGNVIKIEDENGFITKYEYDNLNRVARTIDGRGGETRFSYDNKDRILQVVNPAGQTRKYVYDSIGNLTEFTDYDGLVQKWEYNELNLISAYYDKLGRKRTQEHDVMWNVSKECAANGAETSYEYDALGRLEKVRNPLGAVLEYSYDPNGNLLRGVFDGQIIVNNAYDEANRVIQMLNDSGNLVKLRYDAEGHITDVEDAEGHITKNEYDGNGNLISQTDPWGRRIELDYDSMGRVTAIRDKAGCETKYNYYPGGNLKQIFNPDGTTSSYEYDANGNIVQEVTEAGYKINYKYDVLDRMIEMSSEYGQKKLMTYDAIGNVTSITDANGNKTEYTYSPNGQLLHVTDALGNTAEYQYDSVDDLVEIKQSDGSTVHKTVYERNLLGQIEKITDPLGNIQTYQYDAFGRVAVKVDEDGYKTEYSYTGNGSIQKISYADGNTVQMEYDAMKRLAQIHDWTGKTRFEYDAAGHIAKVIDPGEHEIRYEWGDMDERRGMIYPDGTKVQYEYDEALRLKELNWNDQKVIYKYGTNGKIEEKLYPNQVKTTYLYNKEGLLSELRHEDREGILDQYRYQYDAVGNRIGAEKFRRGTEQENGEYQYRYDGLGRLLEVTKDAESLRKYTYDGFGNRIRMEEKEKQTTGKYNGRNQLVQMEVERNGAKSICQYAYDKRGNLVSESRDGEIFQDYAFGALNRLQTVKKASGETVQHTYNGVLQRVSSRGNSQNIQYILDMTKKYHNLIAAEESGKAKSYLWDDEPVAMIDKSYTYYLADEMGSPVRLMSESGDSAEVYGYDEFGQDLYGNQGNQQPFGYTGYQMDGFSGLYFAQARYYNPRSGRFISADIMKGFVTNPRSMNEYGYVWQNPYRYTDDDGEMPQVLLGIIGGGAVGALWDGGTELVSQIATNGFRNVDWAKVGKTTAIGAAKGAVKGAAISSGAGIVAAVVTGAGGSIAKQTWIDGKKWGEVNYAEALMEGVVDGVFEGVSASKFGQKVAGKVDNFANRLMKNVGQKAGGGIRGKLIMGTRRLIFTKTDKPKTLGKYILSELKKKALEKVYITRPSKLLEKFSKKLVKSIVIPKGLNKILCPA